MYLLLPETVPKSIVERDTGADSDKKKYSRRNRHRFIALNINYGARPWGLYKSGN